MNYFDGAFFLGMCFGYFWGKSLNESKDHKEEESKLEMEEIGDLWKL